MYMSTDMFADMFMRRTRLPGTESEIVSCGHAAFSSIYISSIQKPSSSQPAVKAPESTAKHCMLLLLTHT
jgi:hypothetical protein